MSTTTPNSAPTNTAPTNVRAVAADSSPDARSAAPGQRPVALLAGASRGLGLLLARELAGRGYAVAICARNADELSRAATDVQGEVHTTVCDVTDEAAVTAWVEEVESTVGPIGLAIAIAGIIQVGPAEDMTSAHFREAIDVMAMGPVHVALAVLPHMRRRRAGHIGIVTSIGGVVSPPHLWPYATAKFAAVGFADGLAASLAGSGVTATTIVPGLMRTGSQGRAQFTGNSAAESSWFSVAASLPLLSSGGERAARTIVDAVERGRPIVTVTPFAAAALRVRGLAPGLTTRAMGVANAILPKPTGNTVAVEGRQVQQRHPAWVKALTVLGRRAAARNNER